MSFSPSVPTLISSSNVFVVGNTASGNALSVQQVGAGNVASFRTTTGSTALFVAGSGNVGIGTASPGYPLHVISSGTAINLSNTVAQTAVNAQIGRINFGNGGCDASIASCVNVGGINNNTDLRFYTSEDFVNTNLERMRIDRNGKVGIGTTSPSAGGVNSLAGALLDVYTSGTGVSSNVNISAGCDGSASSTNKASVIFNIKGSGGGIVNGAITHQLLGSNYGFNFQPLTLGTSVMVIKGDGNVGIGTTNPQNLLHIMGEQRYQGLSGGTVPADYWKFYHNGNATNDYGFLFSNATTTAMSFKSAGSAINVGIGTASPGEVFHVVNSTTSNTAYLESYYSGASSSIRRLVFGQTNFRNFIQSQQATYPATNDLLLQPFGGNVGIGTSSPGATLDVVGSSTISTPTYVFFRNSGGGLNSSGGDYVSTQIAVGTSGYGPWIRGVQPNNMYTDGLRLDFCTNITNNDTTPIPRMTILGMAGAAGNARVGIGTTNPGYTLQVGNSNGNSCLNGCLWVNPNNDADQRHYFTIAASTSGIAANADGRLNVQDRSSVYMRFFAGSSTSVTLYGTITQSGGSTLYNASSDYRLKSNIVPLSNALTIINSLKPVSFTFNSHPETVQAGFIAHEVQEVVPMCVTGLKDAVSDDGSILPQGIDKSYIVSYLTAAVKELSAENKDLKTQLASLEQRLAALEARA